MWEWACAGEVSWEMESLAVLGEMRGVAVAGRDEVQKDRRKGLWSFQSLIYEIHAIDWTEESADVFIELEVCSPSTSFTALEPPA